VPVPAPGSLLVSPTYTHEVFARAAARIELEGRDDATRDGESPTSLSDASDRIAKPANQRYQSRGIGLAPAGPFAWTPGPFDPAVGMSHT